MRRILANLAKQRAILTCCALALSACGGVQFDREPGVDRLTPLPTGAEVLVVGSMKEVPSGSQTLGLLRTRRTQERFVRALAEKQLQAAAAPKGCDLLADVHEQRFDGAPRKSGGTIDEFEWQARCIRTAIAAEAAAAPTPAPVAVAPAPAPPLAAKEKEKDEPKYKNEQARLQAEVAAAKEAAKKAAKLAQDKEDQLREYAENAEKEKKKHAAAEAERQKREKEQAEKDKLRAASESADKARAAEKAAEKAHAAADSAEKDRKKLVAEASEKAKLIAEAPTPANFKAVAEAGEKVRVATENAEKLKAAAEQADKDARKASETAAEKAKSLDNEKARAEALERERKAKEEAERKAKEDADRKAKEEADAKAKEEADRKAAATPGAAPVPAAVPVVVDRAAAARAEKEAKAAIVAEKKRQDAEKKRLDAELKRQEAERRKAEAAEKKRKAKEPAPPAVTDADLALKDGSVSALLAHLALRNDTDARVTAALDKRVAETTAEWVTVEGVVVSTVEDERGPKFDADAVAKDVEEAHATGSKFLTPREYSYRYTLRNPAARPVSLDVDLPGQRMRRVLAPGQQVVAQATVPCIAHGAVTKRLENGVLEYHFECNADNQARIVAVRPVERELLLDKRAADAEVPLDVMARIWQALPATALTSQYLAMIDEVMRRRTDALGDFQGRLATQHKTNPDAPTAALATVRNASPHDATVVFDVGTGKEQRLIIPHGQTGEMKLDVPAGVTPELKILGVLPRLRSVDWLLGVWAFKGARMALLPAERGQWTAFLVPTDGGRVTAVGLHVNDGIVQARANVPAAFVKALYGADTPGSCEEGCEVRWMMRVADFDQYVTGAGRALQVEFDAGDRHAVVKFATDH